MELEYFSMRLKKNMLKEDWKGYFIINYVGSKTHYFNRVDESPLIY